MALGHDEVRHSSGIARRDRWSGNLRSRQHVVNRLPTFCVRVVSVSLCEYDRARRGSPGGIRSDPVMQ